MVLDLIQNSERFHRKFTPDSNVLVIGVPNVGKSSLINLVRNGELKIKGTFASKVAIALADCIYSPLISL